MIGIAGEEQCAFRLQSQASPCSAGDAELICRTTMASRARGLDVSWNAGIVHLSEVRAGGIFLKGITLPGFSSRTGAGGC